MRADSPAFDRIESAMQRPMLVSSVHCPGSSMNFPCCPDPIPVTDALL